MLKNDEYLKVWWCSKANGLTTTRLGSNDPLLDFSFNNAQTEINAENKKILPERIVSRKIQWLSQCHGNAVHLIHQENDFLATPPSADACISYVPSVAVAVLTADCLPILLANEQGTTIAAIHGGWRSLAQDIIAGVRSHFSEDSSELVAWLGPCISAPFYEVDDPVRMPIIKKNPVFEEAFMAKREKGKYSFSLSRLATLQLQSMGITRILGTGWCTYTDTRLHSYRRDGSKRGNMATVGWM